MQSNTFSCGTKIYPTNKGGIWFSKVESFYVSAWRYVWISLKARYTIQYTLLLVVQSPQLLTSSSYSSYLLTSFATSTNLRYEVQSRLLWYMPSYAFHACKTSQKSFLLMDSENDHGSLGKFEFFFCFSMDGMNLLVFVIMIFL